MTIINIVIIVLVSSVVYCYLIYPYLIQILARFLSRDWLKDENYRPRVSIIIAVHNEEKVIERCLDSLFELDYPPHLLEICIGSDGSTDGTNILLGKYAGKDKRIKPFFFPAQRGKMLTLNDIVVHARGDILFFVDGDVILSENSLKVHIRNFADGSIGATAGKYVVHTEEYDTLFHTENEYASLEQKIRESEGRISSTMGLYGGNYAIRKSLWKDLPSSLVHDDLFVILSINEQGYRVIYEPESVSTDIYNRSLREEFKRKARSASRGYHTLSYFPDALRFTKGSDTFFLWSHKVLRWLSPMLILLTVLLLIIGYRTNGSSLYLVIIATFGSGALIGFVGYMLEQQGRTIPVMRQITWLLVMNLAYIYGTYQYVFGKDKPIWSMASRAIIPKSADHQG